jgi:hypothetical protein
MKKIYKYNLRYYSEPEIVRLPMGADIIDFGIQNESVNMWALVTPTAKEDKRVFVLVLTGQDIPWRVIEHYGTKIIESTGIVVHLLELEKNTVALDPLKENELKENKRWQL